MMQSGHRRRPADLPSRWARSSEGAWVSRSLEALNTIQNFVRNQVLVLRFRLNNMDGGNWRPIFRLLKITAIRYANPDWLIRFIHNANARCGEKRPACSWDFIFQRRCRRSRGRRPRARTFAHARGRKLARS